MARVTRFSQSRSSSNSNQRSNSNQKINSSTSSLSLLKRIEAEEERVRKAEVVNPWTLRFEDRRLERLFFAQSEKSILQQRFFPFLLLSSSPPLLSSPLLYSPLLSSPHFPAIPPSHSSHRICSLVD